MKVIPIILITVSLCNAAIIPTTVDYRDICEYNWCSHECQRKGQLDGVCYSSHITGKTECKCDSVTCKNSLCVKKCESEGYYNGYCSKFRDHNCKCNLAKTCEADRCILECRKKGKRDGGFCSKLAKECVCYSY